MLRKTHTLKCWPAPFAAQRCGIKNFEIRLNDRHYGVGDVLRLREYDPDRGTYSGEYVEVRVTYMTEFGQKSGYVVLGTTLIRSVTDGPR